MRIIVKDATLLEANAQSDKLFTIDNYTSKIEELNKEELNKELEGKEDLLKEYNENLRILKMDEAIYAKGQVPLYLRKQIKSEEERIRQTEREIEILKDKLKKIEEI